jgi:cytidylate kinase
MLITISRQFGAGGSRVAQLAAGQLGWTVVDNELIEAVARRAGMSADEVAKREERPPSFVERLARALVAAPVEVLTPGIPLENLDEASLVRITERVVEEIAMKGRVVLVGRAAVAVLASRPEALHVQLVAPREFRVRVIMEREQIDSGRAERLLDERDEHRRAYHQEFYHRDWTDPAGYHMVLNTAALGYDGAADLVVARARAVGW